MKGLEISIDINGCWNCTSHATDTNGYPVATINRKFNRMYRHFYAICKGVIPQGLVIRHTCDNKLCINPEHLILGTHADNVEDRVKRKRSATGEKNGRSKLTETEVIIIYKNTNLPIMTLAKKYGVDPKAIRNIKNKQTWRSVTDAI